MIYLASFLVIVVFAFALHQSKIIPLAKQMLSAVKKSLTIIQNKDLADEEKEKLVQKASLHLLIVFFKFVFLSAFVLGAPFLILFLFDRLNWASFDQTMNFLVSWPVLGGTLLLAFVFYQIKRFKK